MSRIRESPLVRMGSRGSRLALWQAERARTLLEQQHAGIAVEIVPVKTTGDRIQEVPLADIGGKALFTRELDQALLSGEIDCAVHSLKDLPFRLPDGVRVVAAIERADPRDAFVSAGRRLEELPDGARVGTSSLRRRAQLLHRLPRLEVVFVRGNVDTRLRKLDHGEFDGLVLAAAGLDRLGHHDRIVERLPIETMLPAIGQGAIAITCRGNDPLESVLESVNHRETSIAVRAERALMAEVEGNCRAPIAGHARLEGERIVLEGVIASPDGRSLVRDRLEGGADEAAALGRRLGARLRQNGGDVILAGIADGHYG